MRNLTGRLGAFGAVVTLGLCASTVAGIAQQATPTDLVDALNGLFGKHAGDRAAHTKGICLSGKFTPSAEAPKLSKAAHFARKYPSELVSRSAVVTRMRRTMRKTMYADSPSNSTSQHVRFRPVSGHP